MGLRRLLGQVGGRAAGALSSQAVNAGGSLVLQIAAARVLGARGFGSFVLLTSALVLLTALYTAFVGDSLTVLDRRDQRIRGALLAAHFGLSGLAAAIGYGLAVALGVLSPAGAPLYAALVFLWLNEELGRRILMARLEFWRLTINDTVYVAVTLVCLLALHLGHVALTLRTVVLSMAIGSAVSIVVGLGQIPATELAPARLQPGALREVAAFATWRSLQAGLRPLVLFLARSLIGGIAGRATLGRVEAGRLLLAPAQTLVGAAGNILLPMYVPGRSAEGRRVTVKRASALLIQCTVAVGVIAVAFAGPLTRFVVGPHIVVPRFAVFGWAAYTCALALGLPASTALVARRMSRTVFLVRAADAVAGLAILFLVLAAHKPAAAPLALAVSTAASALWLQVLAARLPGLDSGAATVGDRPPTRAELPAAQLDPVGRLVERVRLAVPATSRTATPLGRLLAHGNRWALAWVVLPLMIASDYKVRLRDKQASVSGNPDVFVLIEIAVYATVALVLMARVARAPAGRRRTTLINLSWLYAGYFAAAALWSPYRNLAVVRGFQLLLTAAVAQSIARYARRDQLHGLAHAFTALVVGSVIFGKLKPFPPVSNQVRGRFTWLYVHPVVSGVYVGAATVIMIAYLMRSGKPHRLWPTWAYPVALLIVTYGLLATRTRGSLSATVVAALIVVLCGARGSRRADVLVTVGIVLTVGILTSANTILLYLSRGESTAQLSSLNDRTSLWSLAFAAFEQKPVVGWGLTASRGIFFTQIGLGGGHNAFINVLVDGGVVGATGWLALLIGLVFSLRRLWRGVAEADRADLTMLTALVAFLIVGGLTAEYSGAPANVASIWLFVLVGWTGALQRERLLRRPTRTPPPVPRPREPDVPAPPRPAQRVGV